MHHNSLTTTVVSVRRYTKHTIAWCGENRVTLQEAGTHAGQRFQTGRDGAGARRRPLLAHLDGLQDVLQRRLQVPFHSGQFVHCWCGHAHRKCSSETFLGKCL